MHDNRLICIVGPDGAGKSTQAELLIERLTDQGVDCEYRWFRFSHLLSLPVLAIARILGFSEMEELESGRAIGYHHFERSSVLSWLYPIVLLLDMIFAHISAIGIPRWFSNRTIVCDRFVHDTLVGVMISTHRWSFLDSLVGRLFLRLIPADAAVIVINGDEEILRSRRDDVREDETLSSTLINHQRRFTARSVRASTSRTKTTWNNDKPLIDVRPQPQ
jgi:energy-coupling factor transporter ATP-binding protein EcfA2